MLFKDLKDYGNSDFYPFHMPGHKRNMKGYLLKEAFDLDITEIEGFDNLHHPIGIIKNMQEEAANVFQSEETYFLVNGSTSGLLSAICGTTTKEGTLLMARNCHKAVYHGVFLQRLHAEYIYPQYIEEYSLNGGLNPREIEALLKKNKNIQAVLITSPTFDGVVSDVKEIARVVHRYDIPLIVDEAHGSHMEFHEYFPQGAISQGADIVIHSVHKTLPSLTQTALLHINGNLVDREKIKKYLSIFQTSSPSYLLMGSIDQCIKIIKKDGERLFSDFSSRLKDFYKDTIDCKHLRILNPGSRRENCVFDFDRSKVLISCKNTNITGAELYYDLLKNYHLQMEMAAFDYVLGMTSIMDTHAGFDRLIYAIKEIDSKIYNIKNFDDEKASLDYETIKEKRFSKAIISYTISQANEYESEVINLKYGEGRISGEFIYLYPPGIPILVPGEVISQEIIKKTGLYINMGLEVQGLEDYTNSKIKVLKTD